MKNLCISILLLICSCSVPRENGLERVLKSAGDNRNQLEYVLHYYSTYAGDSLKYKAATYLIENMEYHYTFLLDDFAKKKLSAMEFSIDSLTKVFASLKDSSVYKQKDSLYKKLEVFYKKIYPSKIEDAKIIKAKYLIENIEHSFKVWTEQSWAQHLSFNDFCEYILPYKVIDGPPLDNWKAYFYSKYNHLLTTFKFSSIYSKIPYVACDTINRILNKDLNPFVIPTPFQPIVSLKTLSSIPYGPCEAYAILATAVMRANGIPTGMDFTPQWPFRSLGHSWNILLENTYKNLVFEAASPLLGAPHKKDHIMGKVYRNTYKVNRDLEQLARKMNNVVPPVFLSPYIEDVTEEYMSTININLKVSSDNPYIYLAVFDNSEWKIIAWGKNKNGKVSFQNVGRDIIYLPVEYTAGRQEPVADPIVVLANGEIRNLNPNNIQKQRLKLTRKYPLFGDAFTMNMRKINAKIQGANQKDFQDAETFYVYNNLENDIKINPKNKQYRYWRYLSNRGSFVNVAELRFLNKKDQLATGNIIGTAGFQEEAKGMAFDGKLLTFFDTSEIPGEEGWIGIDCKSPTNISRVVCIMRGDGNDVEIGDEYELFFWDNKQWNSVGSKIADDISLVFDRCPTNALFLLHNKTKGIEERIFTYENEKQLWW